MRPRVLSIEEILNRQVLDDPPTRPRPCTALHLLQRSMHIQRPPTSLVPLVPLSPSPTPGNLQASHLHIARAASPVATLDTRDIKRNVLTLYLSDLDKSVAASPTRHSYAEVPGVRSVRGRASIRLPETDLWRSLVQSRADAPVHLVRGRSAEASSQLPRVRRPNERRDNRIPALHNELPKRPPTAATLTARLKLLSRSSAARRAAKSYVDNDE